MDRLYHDPDLARFYDHDNGWSDDNAYCLALAEGSGPVLDLGCGTGRLAAAIASETGATVTGVDPARAMLDLAAARPGGDRVRWIEGDARSVRLGERFDLITMTGHAFQCLLTNADRAACLATIAAHLAPGGQFIFDTRNPARREWEGWHPDATRETRVHPTLGPITGWNDVSWDEVRQVATYDTFYRVEQTGHVTRARSEIGFVGQSDLARLIAAAGLKVTRWLGDWTGAPYRPDSVEIIPLGALAEAPEASA